MGVQPIQIYRFVTLQLQMQLLNLNSTIEMLTTHISDVTIAFAIAIIVCEWALTCLSY